MEVILTKLLVIILALCRQTAAECCSHWIENIPIQNICAQQNENLTQRNSTSWCSKVNYKVLNQIHGTIEVEVNPPPQDSDYDCFTVKLLVLEGVKCSELKSEQLKEDDPDYHDRKRHVHTDEYCIKINKMGVDVSDPDLACSQKMRLEFQYVFTGCYRLRIKQGLSGMSCYTDLFDVTSGYKKSLVPNAVVDLIKVDKYNLEIRNFWSLMPPGSTLDCVITSLINQNEDQNNYHCILDSVLEQSYLKVNPSLIENCDIDEIQENPLKSTMEDVPQEATSSCKCKGLGLINCNFYNLMKGNYKINVEAFDIRCSTATLWRDSESSNSSLCRWHNNDLVIIPSNYTMIVSYDPGVTKLIKHHLNIVIPAILAVVISIAIAMIVCCKYRRADRTWYQIVPQMAFYKNNRYETMNRKVLLLYPRDCQPFMEAMKTVKNILESGNFKVFDPLDANIYEEVAESNNTWGLKYLSDPSTKIVLVASWCSLKLEEGLLTSTPMVHAEKLPFDTIFTTLLNQLYLEDLPYKKIFVVRLDCERVGDLHYKYIASSRNFTLPQCTDALIHQLLELPTETSICMDDRQSQIRKLEESIRRYNVYLRDNPNYLERFLLKDEQRRNTIINSG